jgi:hypothetical protein
VLNKQQWNLNRLILRYLIDVMSLPAKDNTAIAGRTQMTTEEKWATLAFTAVRQITVGKDLPNRDFGRR